MDASENQITESGLDLWRDWQGADNLPDFDFWWRMNLRRFWVALQKTDQDQPDEVAR